MKKPFLIAMALIVAPFGAQAETWNIYGWQNHSWEFVDIDGGRSFDRIQSNAGNIGFAASMDAGNGISVNVRCEQFTYLQPLRAAAPDGATVTPRLVCITRRHG